MNRFLIAAGAVVLLALVTSPSASAGGVTNYQFGMDALQEVPPNPSPGTGQCAVSVDDTGNTVDVNCTFANLLANTTAAHIHAPAPPGMNAGVILGLTRIPPGTTAGMITSNGPQPLSETNIQHILAGNAYVNLHTTMFPGGEIRGQIVPEPAALSLLALGGFMALRRRR